MPWHALVPACPAPAAATPVVLVHGLGLSGRYMRPTAEELARPCRVYVPDLPGFGDTAKPPWTLTVPELADQLAVWLRAMGLSPAVLLGNSFGCQIIADLAARRPAVVAAAILQGPTAPPEERGWFRQWVRWRQNNRFNPRSLGPVSRGDYRKAGYLRVLKTFRQGLDDAIETKMARIRAPVLVVRGALDPICPQGWVEHLAGMAPQGRLAVLPEVAHTLVYTAPRALAETTLGFIDELGLGCR